MLTATFLHTHDQRVFFVCASFSRRSLRTASFYLFIRRSKVDYRSEESIHHWRSTSGFEVDFILGGHTAIEAKAKHNISQNGLRSLRALEEEKKLKNYICVSLEKRPRRIENITVLPYAEFLEMLWSGEFD